MFWKRSALFDATTTILTVATLSRWELKYLAVLVTVVPHSTDQRESALSFCSLDASKWEGLHVQYAILCRISTNFSTIESKVTLLKIARSLITTVIITPIEKRFITSFMGARLPSQVTLMTSRSILKRARNIITKIKGMKIRSYSQLMPRMDCKDTASP